MVIARWISSRASANLPSFISIQAGSDVRAHGSAFLPAAHQGTGIAGVPKDAKESAIRFLNNPDTTVAAVSFTDEPIAVP